MMKSLLAAALALALGVAAAGCLTVPESPRAGGEPDVERLVQRLDGENPFLFADARARLIRLGEPALGDLEQAALAAPQDPADDCLHRRHIIRTIGRIAQRHPAAADRAKEALINIAVETPDFVALNALQELDKFDQESVLLEFIRIATGPDEARRRRARVMLFSTDKKAAVDLMLELLKGELRVAWFRSPAEPARRPDEPDPRERHMLDIFERWTYQDMGYDPEAPREERMEAVARWQEWWGEHRETFDRLFQLEDYLPLIREMEAYRAEPPEEDEDEDEEEDENEDDE